MQEQIVDSSETSTHDVPVPSRKRRRTKGYRSMMKSALSGNRGAAAATEVETMAPACPAATGVFEKVAKI